jgi:hypothetical protein
VLTGIRINVSVIGSIPALAKIVSAGIKKETGKCQNQSDYSQNKAVTYQILSVLCQEVADLYQNLNAFVIGASYKSFELIFFRKSSR